MEIFNSVAKQQSTQVQADQKAPQAKPEPIQKVEVKAHVEQAKEQDGNKPVTTERDVRDLVETLNKSLNPFNTSIRFGFDNSNEVFYVSVIDSNTNDMIRRFPAEKANSLITKMHEIVGIIFDEKG